MDKRLVRRFFSTHVTLANKRFSVVLPINYKDSMPRINQFIKLDDCIRQPKTFPTSSLHELHNRDTSKNHYVL
ncbi:hypothetical protein DVH24_027533 [Malus domestica]|uniref:Uncharacterized protein n=1 Tax=Malus domestica TaxID=3750 RepID=A0A498H7P5_MALDO|nr:hypothetical protein DVH24_027533 [Malus domestica]